MIGERGWREINGAKRKPIDWPFVFDMAILIFAAVVWFWILYDAVIVICGK